MEVRLGARRRGRPGRQGASRACGALFDEICDQRDALLVRRHLSRRRYPRVTRRAFTRKGGNTCGPSAARRGAAGAARRARVLGAEVGKVVWDLARGGAARVLRGGGEQRPDTLLLPLAALDELEALHAPAPARPRARVSACVHACMRACATRRAGGRARSDGACKRGGGGAGVGHDMPSSTSALECGGMEPGVMPPMSAWCPREATKNTGTPPANTGVITVMSGRCVPPATGWLVMSTSPSRRFPAHTCTWYRTASCPARAARHAPRPATCLRLA